MDVVGCDGVGAAAGQRHGAGCARSHPSGAADYGGTRTRTGPRDGSLQCAAHLPHAELHKPLLDLAFSLFLGLAVAGSFVPWGAPTTWLALACVVAVVAWWTRRHAPVAPMRPAVRWIAGALLFYFACYALSAAYHGDRLSLLDKPVRFAVLAAAVLALPRLKPDARVLLAALGVAGVAALAYALFDLFYNNAERVGMFVNPIQYGVFSIAVAVMTTVLAVRLPLRRGLRWALVLSSACAYTAALLTGSLTIVTAAIALPLTLLVARVPRSTRRSRTAVLGMALAACVALGAGGQHLAVKVNKAVEDVELFMAGQPDTSQGARIANFLNSWTLYRSRPVMGVGIGGFDTIRQRMAADGSLAKYAASFDAAHNEYIDTLAKRGLPGIFGLLTVFLVPLWAFRRLYRDNDAEGKAWAAAGLAVVLVFALACATQNVISYSRGVNMMLAAVLMALAMASRSSLASRARTGPPASP